MGYSFEIKNSEDLLCEFCNRVKEYRNDPMSSGNAIICAMLVWHLLDWVYKEFSYLPKKYKKLDKYKEFIKDSCPSFAYMQDIANGSKHCIITRYSPTIKNTKSNEGAFSSRVFSNKAFNVSCLKIELTEGQDVNFDEELEKVENFIKYYFHEELGIKFKK